MASDILSTIILYNLYYLVPELLVTLLLVEVSPGSYMIRLVSSMVSDGDLPKILKLPVVAAFALSIFLVAPPIISAVAGGLLKSWISSLSLIQTISLLAGVLTFNISYTMHLLGASKDNSTLLMLFSISGISIFVFLTSILGFI